MGQSKNLRGIARIGRYYNQPWRGFTLQLGHFFGETVDGQFWVTGLERREGAYKVYLCDTSSGDYVWRSEYLKADHAIVRQAVAAIPARRELGIDRVTFEPLSRQKTGFEPRLSPPAPYPWKGMYIPNAGRPVRHEYIVRDGKTVEVTRYR